MSSRELNGWVSGAWDSLSHIPGNTSHCNQSNAPVGRNFAGKSARPSAGVAQQLLERRFRAPRTARGYPLKIQRVRIGQRLRGAEQDERIHSVGRSDAQGGLSLRGGLLSRKNAEQDGKGGNVQLPMHFHRGYRTNMAVVYSSFSRLKGKRGFTVKVAVAAIDFFTLC